MGVARSMLKVVKDRVMSRFGDRFVESFADTSADSPSKFTAPKRDVYDKMVEAGQIAPNKDSSH